MSTSWLENLHKQRWGYNVLKGSLIGLRARAKITSHFGIPSSGHLRPILNCEILAIVSLFLWFRNFGSTKSDLNLDANSVKLFFREPLMSESEYYNDWESGNRLLLSENRFPPSPPVHYMIPCIRIFNSLWPGHNPPPPHRRY